MKIHDDHMYHGAALIQIAEHPQFTAINSLKVHGRAVHNAYQINADIAVALKYASQPTGNFDEYVFTFFPDNLDELASTQHANPKAFIALVCVKDREICCLRISALIRMVEARRKAAGSPEDAYTVLVTAPKGKGLRVYMNSPGRKGVMLGKEVIISRNEFPNALFS